MFSLLEKSLAVIHISKPIICRGSNVKIKTNERDGTGEHVVSLIRLLISHGHMVYRIVIPIGDS
jgi:hypothetical protein